FSSLLESPLVSSATLAFVSAGRAARPSLSKLNHLPNDFHEDMSPAYPAYSKSVGAAKTPRRSSLRCGPGGSGTTGPMLSNVHVRETIPLSRVWRTGSCSRFTRRYLGVSSGGKTRL